MCSPLAHLSSNQITNYTIKLLKLLPGCSPPQGALSHTPGSSHRECRSLILEGHPMGKLGHSVQLLWKLPLSFTSGPNSGAWEPHCSCPGEVKGRSVGTRGSIRCPPSKHTKLGHLLLSRSMLEGSLQARNGDFLIALYFLITFKWE